MHHRLACFSSPRYFAPLPPGHVFPMRKFPDSAAALTADPRIDVIDPGSIGDADLLRVHTPEYVESIRTGHYNPATALRLGLPWTEALYQRSRAATAGTLAAARRALHGDGLACNLAGGTHHAFPDSGEGFCVFNDIAVAIRALRQDDPYYHLMVIDLDAHQGNGTHFIFANDPHVFTYSVHVGRNYPSRKFPGSLDVELPRWVGGDEYFANLDVTLPRAIEQFEPDLVFFIAGADCHENDRFGQMRLTTEEMAKRDRQTINLCRDWGIPTVITYGGGYNRTEGGTTALHVQTITIAAERFEKDGIEEGTGAMTRP